MRLKWHSISSTFQLLLLVLPIVLLPFFHRGSSRTSTWLGEPSARVRFYDKTAHLRRSSLHCLFQQLYHPMNLSCFNCCSVVVSIVAAGNFVGVLGVLGLRYLKIMPLQLINRLTTETFHVFTSSNKCDGPRCLLLIHIAWFSISYLLVSLSFQTGWIHFGSSGWCMCLLLGCGMYFLKVNATYRNLEHT